MVTVIHLLLQLRGGRSLGSAFRCIEIVTWSIIMGMSSCITAVGRYRECVLWHITIEDNLRISVSNVTSSTVQIEMCEKVMVVAALIKPARKQFVTIT